jgi:hypothetical protein
MKNLLAIAFLVLLFSCKKNDATGSYKVRYSVTGNSVTQFKISYNLTDKYLLIPFTGTRDTTFYQPAGTALKLDAKATSHNDLVGSIFVNDVLKVTLTDNDADNDSKTQVKIDYTLPGN